MRCFKLIIVFLQTPGPLITLSNLRQALSTLALEAFNQGNSSLRSLHLFVRFNSLVDKRTHRLALKRRSFAALFPSFSSFRDGLILWARSRSIFVPHSPRLLESVCWSIFNSLQVSSLSSLIPSIKMFVLLYGFSVSSSSANISCFEFMMLFSTGLSLCFNLLASHSHLFQLIHL